MNMPIRRTRPVTHHIDEHLYEAFLQNATEFLQKARGGNTTAQRAIEVRLQDKDAGLDSLFALVDLTRGDSGQCGIVARFLAGLYNGTDFPFDMTELRGLDADLFEHCMAVLRLDRHPAVEIHKYFPNGDEVFLKMLQDWNLVERPAPPPAGGERYIVNYDSYGNAPGYRDVSLYVKFSDEPERHRVELHFSAADAASIAEDIVGLHRRAWENGGPIDIQPGEKRPRWL
jgi:hypothetical protein